MLWSRGVADLDFVGLREETHGTEPIVTRSERKTNVVFIAINLFRKLVEIYSEEVQILSLESNYYVQPT